MLDVGRMMTVAQLKGAIVPMVAASHSALVRPVLKVHTVRRATTEKFALVLPHSRVMVMFTALNVRASLVCAKQMN
jgi:hypothetical protein